MTSLNGVTLLFLASSLVYLIAGSEEAAVDTQIKDSCSNALSAGLKFWGSAGGGVRNFRKRPTPVRPVEKKPKVVEETPNVDPLKFDAANAEPVIDAVASAKVELIPESNLLTDYHLDDSSNNKDVHDKPSVEDALKDDYLLDDAKAVDAQPEIVHKVQPDIVKESTILNSNEGDALVETKAPTLAETTDGEYDENLIGLASVSHLLRNDKQRLVD